MQIINLVRNSKRFKNSLLSGDLFAYTALINRVALPDAVEDLKTQALWHLFSLAKNKALTPKPFDSVDLVPVNVHGAVVAAVLGSSLPLSRLYRCLRPETIQNHLRFLSNERANVQRTLSTCKKIPR